MTGIFYGADDRLGMTSLFRCAVKMSVITAGFVGVILFFCSEWIAECFTTDREVIDLAAFSIKCMAVGLVPDTLSAVLQRYLQGINQRRLVNFLNFADMFLIPVTTALILGHLFGSRGIMASIAAGKIVFIMLLAVIVFIRTGSLRDFMFLPENFGGKSSDNIYASITSPADVMRESRRAETFCLEHGVSSRDAKLMSLFVEETAGNIITHGKPKHLHKLQADYRLSMNSWKVCMTLRDCCGYFDPSAFYEAHKDDSPENVSGLTIVMRLADEVRYYSAFNSNTVMIYIDTQKGDKTHEGSEH